MLNIKSAKSGKHLLCDDDEVIQEYDTHAQAWRALDRAQHEPVNKQEQTSQWIEDKILNGE